MKTLLKSKGSVLALVLGLVWLFGLSTALAHEQAYEGPGFDTPEAAAQGYLEALAQADLDQMLSVFAIETYIDNHDYAANLARIGLYTPTMIPRVPNATPLIRAMNVETRKQEVVTALLGQLIALEMPALEGYRDMKFDAGEGEAITSFVTGLQEGLQSIPLSQIEVTGPLPLSLFSQMYSSQRNQDNLARQALVYGGDEICSVALGLGIQGNPYVFFCDAIRYGQRWYVLRLGGNLGIMVGLNSSLGGMMPLMP